MNQSNNTSSFKQYTPIEFLDNMKGNKHIVMFDENEDYSKKIQFHFLKNGIDKGEKGIYAMPENVDVIEREMVDNGINVEKCKKENLLKIYQTSNINHYSQDDPFDDLIKRILPSDPTIPCRVVGMLDFDKKTKKGMESFLQAEKKSHSCFDSFSGSWICPYKISEIQYENRLNWIKELVKHHDDSVIFTSSEDKGIAFDFK